MASNCLLLFDKCIGYEELLVTGSLSVYVLSF